MKFFVSFLDFLIQSLILNLELLEVYQVESVSKLLLLLEYLLKICVSITKSNVLEAILMHFLIFFSFYTFPVFNYFGIQFSTSTAEDCVLGNATLELLKLVFNFFALSLFFVKFSLELASHAVVAILGFFKIETNLVNICKCVKVLMLIEHLFRLFVKVAI